MLVRFWASVCLSVYRVQYVTDKSLLIIKSIQIHINLTHGINERPSSVAHAAHANAKLPASAELASSCSITAGQTHWGQAVLFNIKTVVMKLSKPCP